jgi:hypothetical protein
LADCKHLSIQLLKTEALKSYLHAVRAARLLAICRIRAALIKAFVLLGALLFHAGLFIMLPWTLKTKTVIGMCLGSGYMIGGTGQTEK